MTFGERLLLLRRQRGWSQARLAAALETDVNAVGQYERGTSAPRLTTFLRICEALEVSPCEILGMPCSVEAQMTKIKEKLKAAIDAA